MINIKETETASIHNFIQIFATSAAKTLHSSLDSEVYKNLEISLLSSDSISNLNDYKQENILFKSEYATGECESDFALVIPEELIANITDVLMGGKGEEYKGTLSEIEVNASLNIFEKMFKNFEELVKNNYRQPLVFSNSPKILLKDSAEYDNGFSLSKFDFAIKLLIKISDTKEFPVFLLLKIYDLKEVLLEMGLLNTDTSVKALESDIIDINKIADVKIDITAELGRTQIPIKYALELVRGSVVELDTLINSEINVYANGISVAKAQVVAVDDNFALKITKIISPEERLKNI